MEEILKKAVQTLEEDEDLNNLYAGAVVRVEGIHNPMAVLFDSDRGRDIHLIGKHGGKSVLYLCSVGEAHVRDGKIVLKRPLERYVIFPCESDYAFFYRKLNQLGLVE